MITAQKARENMENSYDGLLESISNEISKRSSENEDYLIVSVPLSIAGDIKQVLIDNGFTEGGYTNTFEVSWS